MISVDFTIKSPSCNQNTTWNFKDFGMVILKVALKVYRQHIINVTYSQILRGKQAVVISFVRIVKDVDYLNIMLKFQSPKDYCYETTGHVVLLIM